MCYHTLIQQHINTEAAIQSLEFFFFYTQDISHEPAKKHFTHTHTFIYILSIAHFIWEKYVPLVSPPQSIFFSPRISNYILIGSLIAYKLLILNKHRHLYSD